MPLTTLFFDLDDTLYSNKNGLWEAIRGRMTKYMEEVLGLPADQVPALRKTYFETYGTTLRGLQKHHQVDADEYLAYVHDLPLESYLQPRPELRRLLLSLPQQRWIFTNADAAHASRVLKVLELADCFQGIIDIRAAQFYCKPEPQAYLQAMQIAGEADPHHCVMLDDSTRNLALARKLGFLTVLVGRVENHPAAMHAIRDLMELPDALPELWDRVGAASDRTAG